MSDSTFNWKYVNTDDVFNLFTVDPSPSDDWLVTTAADLLEATEKVRKEGGTEAAHERVRPDSVLMRLIRDGRLCPFPLDVRAVYAGAFVASPWETDTESMFLEDIRFGAPTHAMRRAIFRVLDQDWGTNLFPRAEDLLQQRGDNA